MEYVSVLAVLLSFAGVVCSGVIFYMVRGTTKAQRFAVTLKGNEGAFVGLRVEKHWDRWTFEDIKLPQQPGAFTAEVAPGRLHVPTRNILYYQELANVVE